jgi:hypothetical protein
MKRALAVATVVVLSLVAVSAVRAQNDPRIGTWKLNLAKSRATPGPLPMSETRAYEAQGDVVMVTVEIADANGNQMTEHYNATADGRDYPTGPATGANTLSIKRLGRNVWAGTAKRNGKVVGRNRAVLSQDGKVFTITGRGMNAKGQPTRSVAVFEKQ